MIRISVPLIFPVTIVIARLDIQATWGVNPPGTETTGFDPVYREPLVSYEGGYRRGSTRTEMAEVSIQCQPETQTAVRLNMIFGGNNPVTDKAYVLHRKTLEARGLLSGGMCVFKAMDRIVREEDGRGNTTWTPPKPLFVYEVRPASHGFGTTGYDLDILYTTHEDLRPR